VTEGFAFRRGDRLGRPHFEGIAEGEKMRSFLVAMGMLLVIIATILTSYFTLRALSHKNAENLRDVYNLVLQQDWHAAGEKLDTHLSDYENHRWVYMVLIDHMEVDQVELSMISAQKSIETANQHDALDALARGIFLFEHIEERNRFSYENVL